MLNGYRGEISQIIMSICSSDWDTNYHSEFLVWYSYWKSVSNKIFYHQHSFYLILSIWHIRLKQQISDFFLIFWQLLHYSGSIWLQTVAFVLLSKETPAVSGFDDRWLAWEPSKEGSLTKDVIFNTSVCLILNITYALLTYHVLESNTNVLQRKTH